MTVNIEDAIIPVPCSPKLSKHSVPSISPLKYLERVFDALTVTATIVPATFVFASALVYSDAEFCIAPLIAAPANPVPYPTAAD